MVEGGITITQKYKFDVTVADGNCTFTSGTLRIEMPTEVFNINSSMLSSASNSMSFSNIPGDAVITSNEAKTSYTIAINEDGVTVYYIITKQDKK